MLWFWGYPFLLVRRPAMNPTEPPMSALWICHICLRERQEILAPQIPIISAPTTATVQPAFAMCSYNIDYLRTNTQVRAYLLPQQGILLTSAQVNGYRQDAGGSMAELNLVLKRLGEKLLLN